MHLRKLFISLILTMALGTGAFSASIPCKRGNDGVASGHLYADSCRVDMGVVARNSIAESIFRFRNTGTAAFQILSVFSDCGCTTTSYPTDPIPPQETGEIRVRFNSRDRKPGPFRKTLRVRTDADNPKVSLIIYGTVE